MENVGPTKRDNVWDFVLLNPLTEETLLQTLFCRFNQSHIYAYIGNELLSFNPYRTLELYSEEYVRMYLYKAAFLLPPHIFSIVSSAYRWLNDSNEDQCIILSGDSGSGKTENLKKMLGFISYINRDCTSSNNIVYQIIHANNILEAFGNSETIINRNSSRFGKFINVEFNFKGDPISAGITSYLLDKDRVVNQPFGERNFHIFYQLLQGADTNLLKILKLHRNVLTYAILRQCGTLSNDDDDHNKFITFRKSADLLMFDYDSLLAILKIVAVILKLGDLVFVSVTNIDGTEGCSVSNEHELYDICQLLGVDIESFSRIITNKNVFVQQYSEHTLVSTEMCSEEASFYRNNLCKTLYNRLFMWLVKTIDNRIKIRPQCKRRRLSVLDLFGFETLEKNEFYQFVVNYVTEKVFLSVFQQNIRSEQEEYVREGIEWTYIDYVEESVCENNELIYRELFSILDHGQNCSGDCDEICTAKRLARFKLSGSTTQQESSCCCFKVTHYAGEVLYEASGFIYSNSHIVSKDASILMYKGTHPLLKKLFPEGSPEMSSLGKQQVPISKQLKIALNGILRNISRKKLFYVRCIKPNKLKDGQIFETDVVLQQIRTHKIIETIRLRRSGFSFGLQHQQFLDRYKMLSLETWPVSRLPPIQSIQYLIHDLPIPSAEFVFGRTKIFIRSPRSVYELEEYRRQRLDDIAVIIQSSWRKFVQRRRFLKLCHSQIVISRFWRTFNKMKGIGVSKRKRQEDWAATVIQKHYIQWKRHQFLKTVIILLSNSLNTLSPINQEWLSCSGRLKETSLILRKLHHMWRCQKYRSEFSQTARNKMREKVTASYLFKNKKCCYVESVSKPFLGDYIRLRQSQQWKRRCWGRNDHYVVFADVVNKVARSSGKFIPMILVISTSSMMMMDQKTLDLKYRVPVYNIHRISVSPFADNIAVVHIYSNDNNSSISDVSQCFSSSNNTKNNSSCFPIDDLYEKGDIIFQTNHVIEVVTKLFLVVQNAIGRPVDVNISSPFNAYFHQQIVTISFYLMSPPARVQSEQIKVFRKGNRMDIYI